LDKKEPINFDNPLPDFKWPISVTQEINAPIDQVWKVISMPGNLEYCHPFCVENPVEVWPGPGSRDRIQYPSGWVMQRSFVKWIEGIGYDLEIGRPGGSQSFVSWRIKAIEKNKSILRITVYPHILQKLPVLVRWLPHYVYIKPQLKKYLQSVTRGFEWYIINDEPVPRNHFGYHPWFSPKAKGLNQ
jgi:hypothetical protein